MITKAEILAELDGCAEPQKKLHEIADRENLPVMVIRKMLRDLVKIEPPEPEQSNYPVHYSVSRRAEEPYEPERESCRWTDGELKLMTEYWDRNATIREIAEIMGTTTAVVNGVVCTHRDLFPRRRPPRAAWTSEEITLAADLWRDPSLTAEEIAHRVGRSAASFDSLRLYNRQLFPLRQTWRYNDSI